MNNTNNYNIDDARDIDQLITSESVTEEVDIAKLNKAIALNNSSLFDVHKWSEYTEVNRAVDFIYTELKSINGFGVNSSVRKKHLKVVILDLYVKWLVDPEMYSSYYRADWYYRDLLSRYNKLFISRINTKVIDALEKMGYLTSIKGNFAREKGWKSHIARMRATDKLIDKIVNHFHITPIMVELAPDTECIVMREFDISKKRQVDVDYSDDEYPMVANWRKDLIAYNNLLRATYIDIPSIPRSGLVTSQSKDRVHSKHNPNSIRLSQSEKFIKRIFNNNNWANGGRFYGGWWQRIPREWRLRIRIWNMPVSEIDYRGLHIVILYALLGIDYREDPYLLDGLERSDRMRELLKQVLLCSINAKDRGKAISAVRKEINFNPDMYQWTKEEGLSLEDLIDAFVSKHKPIEKFFFSSMGIELQNMDSRIAELIINHFTLLRIPVLCIHDSFLISADKAEDLKSKMLECYKTVITEKNLNVYKDPNTKEIGLGVGQWSTILSDPNWKDVLHGYFKDQYDYPEWYKSFTEFQSREFTDYYR